MNWGHGGSETGVTIGGRASCCKPTTSYVGSTSLNAVTGYLESWRSAALVVRSSTRSVKASAREAEAKLIHCSAGNVPAMFDYNTVGARERLADEGRSEGAAAVWKRSRRFGVVAQIGIARKKLSGGRQSIYPAGDRTGPVPSCPTQPGDSYSPSPRWLR